MLRIVFLSICFATVSCAGTMESSFDWNIVYEPTATPSCVVSFSDEYWNWRYTQGLPVDRHKDVVSLYHRYLDLSATGHNALPIALCNGDFLMSEELARVMNSFGENSSPITIYYQVVSRWSDGTDDRKNLTLAQFENLILSSIKEVESRF